MKNKQPVALITGAAKRIGAQTAKTLHHAGMRIILHYHHSAADALEIVNSLNAQRPDSACSFPANLSELQEIEELAQSAKNQWGRLDALVNNASAFYPTELESLDKAHWDALVNINMRAPLFLSCALADMLSEQEGCIINIGDIHAIRPLKNHTVYSTSKAGLAMITQSLAKELAPRVRCNMVSPGAILWPEKDYDDERKQDVLDRTMLKREGIPEDIASAVLFLVRDANYITGQTIAVDGGRTLYN